MKRVTDFSTIALSFSLFLVSASGVKAQENVSKTEAATSLNDSVLVAQAETTNEFVTLNKNTTTGAINIVEEDGKQYIEFADDFQTTKGPDLEIILHKGPAVPLNIEEKDYVTIAPIQDLSGTQRYLVPEDINLNNFASVAVWCKQFNITFGYVQL